MVKSPSEPGITVEDVTVERGGHTALSEVSFSVGSGTLLGVLGPNGAGKSTLFESIVGLLPLAQGTVKLHGSAALDGGLAYVPQRDSINWRFPATVLDVVTMGRWTNSIRFWGPGRGDRDGKDGQCTYRCKSTTASERWWTLRPTRGRAPCGRHR